MINWWCWTLLVMLISLAGGRTSFLNVLIGGGSSSSGVVLALNVAVDINNTCNIPKTAAVKFSDKSFAYTKDTKTFETYCNTVNMQLAGPEDIEGALCILNQVPKNYRIHSKLLVRFNDEMAILEPYTEDPLKQVRVPLFTHYDKYHHHHHPYSSHVLCVKDMQTTSVPLKRRRGEEDTMNTTTLLAHSVTNDDDSKEPREFRGNNLIKRLFNVVIKQQHRRGESIQSKRNHHLRQQQQQRHVVAKSTSPRDLEEESPLVQYKNKLKANLEARKTMAVTPQNRRPPSTPPSPNSTTEGQMAAETKPQRGFFASLFGSSPKRIDRLMADRQRSLNRANRSSLSLSNKKSVAEDSIKGMAVTTTPDPSRTAEPIQNLDTLKATLYRELGLDESTPPNNSSVSNGKSEEEHSVEAEMVISSDLDRIASQSKSNCTMKTGSLSRDDEECIMAEEGGHVTDESLTILSTDANNNTHKDDTDLMWVLDEMSRLISWMIDEEQGKRNSTNQSNLIVTNQTETQLIMNNTSDDVPTEMITTNSSIDQVSSNMTTVDDCLILVEVIEQKSHQETKEIDHDEHDVKEDGKSEEDHDEEDDDEKMECEDDDDKDNDNDDHDDDDNTGVVAGPPQSGNETSSIIPDPSANLKNVTDETATTSNLSTVIPDSNVQESIGNETQRLLMSRRGMTPHINSNSSDNAMRRILEKKIQQMSSARKQLQSIHGIYNNVN